MTREQLNTDLLINLNVALSLNNLLLLDIAKMPLKDGKIVVEKLEALAETNQGLRDKSVELDKRENGE